MNLGEIRTRVQRQFGDVSGAQISTDDIDRWANDAQTDIVRRTEALEETALINVVAGTENYALPADFFLFTAVYHDGLLLVRTTLEELNNLHGNRYNAAFTGTPRQYFERDGNIYLYPNPDASLTSGLKVWYIRRPVALSGPTDVPEIPLQMHEDIVRYCLMRAKELNEDFDQAKVIEQDYERRVANAAYESQWPFTESYPSVRSVPGDDY